MRSGAAVVPIDTDHPAVSSPDLVEDAAAKVVLVDEPGTWSEPLNQVNPGVSVVSIETLTCEADANPGGRRRSGLTSGKSRLNEPTASPGGSGEILPGDLAYVIYTSGSTGRPKGVMIDQCAIANTVRWRADHVPLSAADRVLMLLSHQFDAGFGIMVSTLAQGATIVWPDDRSAIDFTVTIEQIKRQEITILPAIPGLLQVFANHPGSKGCESIRQIWSGGESMPPDLPNEIRTISSARVWNFYGPTEAAVEAAACEVTDHDSKRFIPIGKPISNTDILVLDDAGNLLPETVPGQLAITGRGLARGYLNDRAKTETCFVPTAGDLAFSSRMYLTGDLGRRRADGSFEFLGRIDQQVKVRGYRIELEEIENVLRSHPAVKTAAVKLIKPNSPAAHLAAFVVPAVTASSDGLRSSIQRHLTDHLVAFKRPGSICFIDDLPIGPNGKVIRSRLPDEVAIDQHQASLVPASTKFEQYLADCWCEMLEIKKVGINQNFFELGGSSLQAAMMTAKLTEDLGVHVPTALLFDLADIQAVSRRLVDLHRHVIELRFGTESVEAYVDPSMNERFYHPLVTRFPPVREIKHGEVAPLFMIHPPGGIVICYRELARQIDDHRPLVAIRSRGLHGNEDLPTTLQAMASEYVDAIRITQPSGPYVVGGWSLGGVIAYEVAQQLVASGEPIERLILLDSTIPDGASDSLDPNERNRVGLEYGIDLTLEELSKLDEDDQLPFLWQHAMNLGVIDETSHQDVVKQVLRDLKGLFHHHVKLTSQYHIRPLAAPALLVRPTDVPVDVKTTKDRGWGELVCEVDVRFISGHHHSMIQQPHVRELAEVLDEVL